MCSKEERQGQAVTPDPECPLRGLGRWGLQRTHCPQQQAGARDLTENQFRWVLRTGARTQQVEAGGGG